MQVRITTLSEDRVAGPDLIGQLGLSILVESEEGNVLFDAGQGVSAAHNADVLGVNLSKIDTIVLSHGHFDHTGGLRDILRKIGKKEMEIVAHPDIWARKHVRAPAASMDRFVGIPFRREELERLGGRFTLTKQPFGITSTITTTGEFPMTTPFERLSPAMLVWEGTDFKPDEVPDDQALIINTRHGLIVILGCAHRGAINTLYHVQRLTGVKKIHMVLGGCHLIEADSGPRIRATIDALKELDVQKVGVSHCVGLPASVQMAQALGDRFFFNNAGTTTIVD